MAGPVTDFGMRTARSRSEMIKDHNSRDDVILNKLSAMMHIIQHSYIKYTWCGKKKAARSNFVKP